MKRTERKGGNREIYTLLCEGVGVLTVPPYRPYSGVIREMNEIAEEGKMEGGIKSEGGEIVITTVRGSRRYVGTHLLGKMVYLICYEMGDVTEEEMMLAEKIMRAYAMEEMVLEEEWVKADRMVRPIVERK